MREARGTMFGPTCNLPAHKLTVGRTIAAAGAVVSLTFAARPAAAQAWRRDDSPPRARSIESITVSQAVAMIREASGRPAVIVFYKTNCPLSQAMFTSLVALAREQSGADVAFLVFSVDDKERMRAVPGFLAHYGAPFPPVYIQPWAPGTFTAAMAGLGIKAGRVWNTPLVAVRDTDGRIVTQAQGPTDVSVLSRVLATLR